MEKTFIMTLDNKMDLLQSEPPLGKVEEHPVAFTVFKTIVIKKDTPSTILSELLAGYEKREFVMTPDNYGLDVSINYEEGMFKSMLLKGTGIQGERINDSIATMFVPKESKNKKAITMHALITIQDLQEFRFSIRTKYDIPGMLRQRLTEGFKPYEDKKIVCRPYKLFIDGTTVDPYDVWGEIGNMLITGLSVTYTHEDALTHADQILNFETHYLLPQRGMMIADTKPTEEGAFPETHLLFEELTIEDINDH